MSNETLRIIGLVLLSVLPIYVFYVWKRYGTQKSISMSYYCWKTDKRWIFQLTIWLTAIGGGLAFQTTLGYIASGLLLLVAVFPTIRIEWHKKIHMFGAILSIILYMLSTYVDFKYVLTIPSMIFLTCVVYIVDYFTKEDKESSTIWDVELIAFCLLIVTVIKQT